MSTTSRCCWCDPLPCRQALDRSQSQSKLRCSPCIGKKLATDPGILLSFLPSEKPQKRRKRSHTNVSNTLVARPSTPPAQTPQRSFQGAAAGIHTPPQPLTAHTAAYTAKQGAFWMRALSLPSERFARFGNSAWPGIRTAYFAAFGSWSGVLPKSAESLRDSDTLMRVAVPRRRGPAGLRDPIVFSSHHIDELHGFAQPLRWHTEN